MQAPFDIAADLDTPVSAYLKLGALRQRFLLESVEGGERLARYSFLGFGDALEVRMDSEGFRVNGEQRPRPATQGEYLDVLRAALAKAPSGREPSQRSASSSGSMPARQRTGCVTRIPRTPRSSHALISSFTRRP